LRLIRLTVFLALGTASPSGSFYTAAAQTVPASTPTPAKPAPCSCATVNVRHTTPYSYRQTTTQVRTLANGTTITNVSVTTSARDTEGRVRTDGFRSDPNGTQIHSVNISDSALAVSYNWVVNPLSDAQKIVNLYHYRQNPQPQTPATQPARRYYPTTSQSLPPQTIEGLYAEGTRSTRTTPAGYEGNDHDIVVVTEIWFSPDLGIQLRRTIDDPRNGKSTMEVTDIQQAAPDPALFKLPDGYQVRDQNPTTP